MALGTKEGSSSFFVKKNQKTFFSLMGVMSWGLGVGKLAVEGAGMGRVVVVLVLLAPAACYGRCAIPIGGTDPCSQRRGPYDWSVQDLMRKPTYMGVTSGETVVNLFDSCPEQAIDRRPLWQKQSDFSDRWRVANQALNARAYGCAPVRE